MEKFRGVRKFIKLQAAFSKQLRAKHVSAYASSTAFFMFLSLIPILLLICSVIPYTPVTEADLILIFSKIVPESMNLVVTNIVTEVYEKSKAVVSVSIVAVIWSAGKGILALVRGLNVINEVKETRNYVILRIRACIYTVILLISIIFSLIIMVFGKKIVYLLINQVPQLTYIMQFFLEIRYVIGLMLLSMFFIILYSLLPNERVKWRTQVPGAVLVSVIWSAFSWGFSYYIDTVTKFGMYGSLSTLVIAMLWMYMCMYIIMFGALVNRFLMPANEFFYQKRRMEKIDKKNKVESY